MGCSWEIQTETVQMHDPILKLLLLFLSFCFVIHIFFYNVVVLRVNDCACHWIELLTLHNIAFACHFRLNNSFMSPSIKMACFFLVQGKFSPRGDGLMPQESAVCISVWSKIKFLRTLCNTNKKMSLIQHMVQYQFFNLTKKIKPKRK